MIKPEKGRKHNKAMPKASKGSFRVFIESARMTVTCRNMASYEVWKSKYTDAKIIE